MGVDFFSIQLIPWRKRLLITTNVFHFYHTRVVSRRVSATIASSCSLFFPSITSNNCTWQVTSWTCSNTAGNSYQFFDQSQLTSQTYGLFQENDAQLSYTGQIFDNFTGNLDEMYLQHRETDVNFDSTSDNENNVDVVEIWCTMLRPLARWGMF